jgi:hypothetical protein
MGNIGESPFRGAVFDLSEFGFVDFEKMRSRSAPWDRSGRIAFIVELHAGRLWAGNDSIE